MYVCMYVCMYGGNAATWEEHYVGMFILPAINGPSDGLAVAVSICMISALQGAHWWTQVRSTPQRNHFLQESIIMYVCMYVCMCFYMTSVPTKNQTNKYILYLLNTDDFNYTIKTLSLCMCVSYVCMNTCTIALDVYVKYCSLLNSIIYINFCLLRFFRVRVLDLCSSWVSHIPPGTPVSAVSGLGMNAEELRRNPLLSDRVVLDLNTGPKVMLPFQTDEFHAVLLQLSM
jgi:hypothetical protein